MRKQVGPLRVSLIFTLALAGCGGGSDTTVSSGETGGGETGGGEPREAVITGFSGDLSYGGEAGAGGGVGDGADGEGGIGAGGSLGQFRGALAVASYPDGREIGRATVDDLTGLVTIRLPSNYAGPIYVEFRGAQGATYFDEALKSRRPFPSGDVLRARVPFNTGNIGVTPFTEAAVTYMEANTDNTGSGLAARIEQSNTLVRNGINKHLPNSYRIDKITRLPVLINQRSGSASAPNTPAGNYAVVLAAIADMAHTNNPGLSSPARSVSQQLAAEFTDGVINDKQKNGDSLAPAPELAYSSDTLAASMVTSINESSNDIGDPADQPTLPAVSKYGYYQLLNDGVLNTYRAFLRSDGTVRAALSARGGNNPEFTVATGVSSIHSGIDNLASFNVLLMRRQDGSMAGLGSNRTPSFGLATAATGQSDTAIALPSLNGIKLVKFGSAHQIGLLQNGVVQAWGSNAQGQLGSTVVTTSVTPITVALDGLASAIGGSANFSLALMSNGQVRTWGTDARGGLGQGVLSDEFVRPGAVRTANGILDQVFALATCASAINAIRTDGSVWAWGDDSLGLLGNNDPSRAVAAPIPNIPAMRKVLMGIDGAYGLTETDTVWFWGLDANRGKVLPRQVPGLPAIRDLVSDVNILAFDGDGAEIRLANGARQ